MTRQFTSWRRFEPFVLVLASSIVALLACEIVLRVFRVGENVHTTASLSIFAPDPELGWVLRPDIRVSRAWGGRTIVIRADQFGRRIADEEIPIVDAEQIPVSGDSFVFGNEVNAEETFVHRLSQASSKKMVNLGIGGYSLSQASLALRRFMAESPAVARGFLVIYVGNDIEFGAYPPEGRGVDPEGFLRDASPATWRMVRIRAFVLRHSRLLFNLQNAWRRLRLAAPSDAMPAAADGGDRWIYDEQAATSDRLEEHRLVLAALRDDAAKRGVALTVVILPEKDQVYGSLSDLPNQMLQSIVSELGMPVIDLLPKMRHAAGQRPPLWHDGPQGHLSPEGHRFVAEVLAESLR